MFNPLPLIRLIGSRSYALLLILASVVITVAGWGAGSRVLLPVEGRGFGFAAPWEWLPSRGLSLAAALACDLAVVAGIFIINRNFNLIRGLRGGGLLFAALYMMMEGVAPSAGHFSGGNLLVLVVLASIFLLYSVYQSHGLTRRVLLVFAMLGAGSLVSYGFMPYILVMAAGCVQMRVMNLRTLIAIVAGTLVPAWILWSFGVISFDGFAVPAPSVILSSPDIMLTMPLAVGATLVAVVAGFASGLLDMLQVYARNARTRAFFGLMAVTGLMTCILSVADFANVAFYAPLLNLTTAFLATLLYSFHPRGSLGAGTVVITVLTILYLALYIWKIIVI